MPIRFSSYFDSSKKKNSDILVSSCVTWAGRLKCRYALVSSDRVALSCSSKSCLMATLAGSSGFIGCPQLTLTCMSTQVRHL